MAKKSKKKDETESEASGRFHIVITPKAYKELMTPLLIENYYDPALVTFAEKDAVHINTHDAGKQTMMFIDGKFDGLRVLEPGQMVVNPKEMMKRVVPKFGSAQQFSIQEQEDGSYKFFDEWGAYIEWTPDSASDCRVVKESLAPKMNDEGFLDLFGGEVVTDCKATGKAGQFQSAGADATAAGADYIELNLNHDNPFSVSGHLIPGTVRSRTPIEVDVDGSEVKAVVPKSFSKFAALLSGEVDLFAADDSPAVVLMGKEPDRSYVFLVGTTEPTETSSEDEEEE